MPEPIEQTITQQIFALFGVTDLSVMVSIGVLAFVLIRWEKCPNWFAVMGSTMLGGLWGLATALDSDFHFGAHILKGLLVNGASATLVAWIVHRLLDAWHLDSIDEHRARDAQAQPPPPADQ